MCSQELSSEEIFTLMQVLQATCSMPVVGDTILQADEVKEGEQAKQPEIARLLSWNDRIEVFASTKLYRGCLILPDFVPDSLIPLNLQPDALEQLV